MISPRLIQPQALKPAIRFGESQQTEEPKLPRIEDFTAEMPTGEHYNQLVQEVIRRANARDIQFAKPKGARRQKVMGTDTITYQQAKAILYRDAEVPMALSPHEAYYLGQIVDGNHNGQVSLDEMVRLFHGLDIASHALQGEGPDDEITIDTLRLGKVMAHQAYLASEATHISLPSPLKAKLINALATDAYTATSHTEEHCDLAKQTNRKSDVEAVDRKTEIAVENLDDLITSSRFSADQDNAQENTERHMLGIFAESGNMPYVDWDETDLSKPEVVMKRKDIIVNKPSIWDIYWREHTERINPNISDLEAERTSTSKLVQQTMFKAPNQFPSTAIPEIPLVKRLQERINTVFRQQNTIDCLNRMRANLGQMTQSQDGLKAGLQEIYDIVADDIFALNPRPTLEIINDKSADILGFYYPESNEMIFNFAGLLPEFKELEMAYRERKGLLTSQYKGAQEPELQREFISLVVSLLAHELAHAYTYQMAQNTSLPHFDEKDQQAVDDYRDNIAHFYNSLPDVRALMGNINWYANQPWERASYDIEDYTERLVNDLLNANPPH